MTTTLLASSSTEQGIAKLVKDFYRYNKVCEIDFANGTISNANGIIKTARVIKRGKRFRFEIVRL
jgi:hypothetical protein